MAGNASPNALSLLVASLVETARYAEVQAALWIVVRPRDLELAVAIAVLRSFVRLVIAWVVVHNRDSLARAPLKIHERGEQFLHAAELQVQDEA